MFAFHGGMSVVMILLCIKNKRKNVSIAIRNLSITMNIFLSIAFLFAALGAVWTSVWGYGPQHLQWLILYIIYSVFLYLGISNIYLLMLYRLKLTFEGSAYEISKSTMHLFYLSLFIILCFIILAMILFPLEFYTLFVFSLSTAIVLSLFGALQVTYLFNKKLFLLILTQRQSALGLNVEQNATTVELTHQQLMMINVITKHTLLQIVTISAFALTSIVSGIVTLTTINAHFGISINTFLYALAPSLMTVSITRCLAFVEEPWYFRCCGCCHSSIKNYCIGLAEKMVAKRIKQTAEAIRSMSSISTMSSE